MNTPVLPHGGNEPRLPVERPTSLAVSTGHAPQDEYGQDGFDLGTVWRILWDKRLLILAVSGICLLIALAYSLLQAPLYRSTATLELNPPTIPILNGGGGDNLDLVVPKTDYEFLATQYGLLKSKALAIQVAEDLKLSGAPEADDEAQRAKMSELANRLMADFTVNPLPSSRLVELSYRSESPKEAARIVNGFGRAFITSTLQRRYQAAADARGFLEKRLAEVRERLDDAERKLVDYAQKNGIIITGSSEMGSNDADSLQGASLVALNGMLAEAQQRRFAAEQRYRNMSGAGTAAEVSSRTASLREDKAKLEAEFGEKSTFLKDDYPEMVRLRSRIEGLDKAIRAEASNVSGSRSSTLRSEYQAALQEEHSLQGRVNQLKGAVLNLRERSIQYNILERELDTNRSLYDSLLKRYNEIGVSGGADTPQATLVDPGSVPAAPYSPKTIQNCLIGLLLGFVLGGGAAFVLHYIMDRIVTPDDIREKLRLPPLGVVPKKQRNEELFEVLDDRRSVIFEAYASLVTTLQFTTSSGMPHALLVTSTIAEEGKSTTSFAIARLLAQHGKRVLLIDADLRKPSFVIEERSDIGFSQMVLDGSELQKHVISTNEPNLWLLPSGPPPPNPVQILASQRAAAVIEQARAHFDIVIVDAPPTYGFADAPMLAAMCDAVLMVVESGKTRRRPASEAISRLRMSGATIVGAALTKYRFDHTEYGYRYYEAYGESAARIKPHELAVGLIEKRGGE